MNRLLLALPLCAGFLLNVPSTFGDNPCSIDESEYEEAISNLNTQDEDNACSDGTEKNHLTGECRILSPKYVNERFLERLPNGEYFCEACEVGLQNYTQERGCELLRGTAGYVPLDQSKLSQLCMETVFDSLLDASLIGDFMSFPGLASMIYGFSTAPGETLTLMAYGASTKADYDEDFHQNVFNLQKDLILDKLRQTDIAGVAKIDSGQAGLVGTSEAQGRTYTEIAAKFEIFQRLLPVAAGAQKSVSDRGFLKDLLLGRGNFENHPARSDLIRFAREHYGKDPFSPVPVLSNRELRGLARTLSDNFDQLEKRVVWNEVGSSLKQVFEENHDLATCDVPSHVKYAVACRSVTEGGIMLAEMLATGGFAALLKPGLKLAKAGGRVGALVKKAKLSKAEMDDIKWEWEKEYLEIIELSNSEEKLARFEELIQEPASILKALAEGEADWAKNLPTGTKKRVVEDLLQQIQNYTKAMETAELSTEKIAEIRKVANDLKMKLEQASTVASVRPAGNTATFARTAEELVESNHLSEVEIKITQQIESIESSNASIVERAQQTEAAIKELEDELEVITNLLGDDKMNFDSAQVRLANDPRYRSLSNALETLQKKQRGLRNAWAHRKELFESAVNWKYASAQRDVKSLRENEYLREEYFRDVEAPDSLYKKLTKARVEKTEALDKLESKLGQDGVSAKDFDTRFSSKEDVRAFIREERAALADLEEDIEFLTTVYNPPSPP